MIKLIGALLFYMTSPAYAADEVQQVCAQIGELAQSTMIARQGGVAISQLWPEDGSGPETIISIHRAMLLEAYKTPQYHTEERQVDAVNEFRNIWETACFGSVI